MSIHETSVIDFVSTDSDAGVVLSVSDHLDWSVEGEHLRLLQEKVNTYCHYVESGQLYDVYPEMRDRRPTISIVFSHEPTPKAVSFLQRAKSVLEKEGFDLAWKKYPAS